MTPESEIHKKIDELLDHLSTYQKTLMLLGFPEYWPNGESLQLDPPNITSSIKKEVGSSSIKTLVAQMVRDEGRTLSLDQFDDTLKKGALSHEVDYRVRRRKISQALYANRDILKAIGGSGRRGGRYGLLEWFDGDKLKKEYK